MYSFEELGTSSGFREIKTLTIQSVYRSFVYYLMGIIFSVLLESLGWLAGCLSQIEQACYLGLEGKIECYDFRPT
jgi:hypothetical protein